MEHLDSGIMAEARVLLAKGGMQGFQPQSDAPTTDGGDLFAIALIDSPKRDPGFPNFDKPLPEAPEIVRSTRILQAIREGTPLPPLVLRTRGNRYLLRDGFHRLHLAAALGFTHVRAIIDDWDFEVP